LFSKNLNHDLMVGINYKINLIMYYYLSCAYPQYGGDKRVTKENATNTDYFIKIIIETVQQRILVTGFF